MCGNFVDSLQGFNDKYNYFPLNLAAREGHAAIVELLLARGSVDVNQASSDTHSTALLEVVYQGFR